MFTNTIFGFLRGYVLLAIFALRPTAGGFDARDTITYAWATQGLIMTVFIWGWLEVAERVQDGSIAMDLLRPMDVQNYWLAHDIGRATFHIMFRGIPPFLIGSLFFDLRLPERPLTWVALGVSLYLAIAVSFGVKFSSNLLAFWLLDYRGVNAMIGIVMNVLSGFLVPITFFPGWLALVARASPFASVVQIPIEIFLEKPGALSMLWLQAFWAVALHIIGRAVLNAGTRKLVIQGG